MTKEEILARYAEDFIVPDMNLIDQEEKPYIREFINIKRKKKKITVEKISNLSDVPTSTINRVLNPSDPNTSCSVMTAGAICKAMDFSLDAYFGIKQQKSSMEHEIEKLEIKVEYLQEQKEGLIAAFKTRAYIMYGLIVALMFCLIDLLCPDIGITAGNYMLAYIFVAIAVCYVGVVLFGTKKEIRNELR